MSQDNIITQLAQCAPINMLTQFSDSLNSQKGSENFSNFTSIGYPHMKREDCNIDLKHRSQNLLKKILLLSKLGIAKLNSNRKTNHPIQNKPRCIFISLKNCRFNKRRILGNEIPKKKKDPKFNNRNRARTQNSTDSRLFSAVSICLYAHKYPIISI